MNAVHPFSADFYVNWCLFCTYGLAVSNYSTVPRSDLACQLSHERVMYFYATTSVWCNDLYIRLSIVTPGAPVSIQKYTGKYVRGIQDNGIEFSLSQHVAEKLALECQETETLSFWLYCKYFEFICKILVILKILFATSKMVPFCS